MSLNKASLQAAIKQALLNRITAIAPTDEQKTEAESIAGDLATAIDSYVKSAQIVYTNGLVSPPGTSGGPVTGTFNGNLE